MMDMLPKLKGRLTGGVENTRGTFNNILSRIRTGQPNIIDIPTKHVEKFARMNRELIGK